MGRFLDGLLDHKISLQVEFVKGPSNIDDAVVEVKTYQESSKRNKVHIERSKVYMVKPPDAGDPDAEEVDGDRAARVPDKRTTKLVANSGQASNGQDSTMHSEIKKIHDQLARLESNLQQMGGTKGTNIHYRNQNTHLQTPNATQTGRNPRYMTRGQGNAMQDTQQQNGECYSCGL